AKRGTDHAGGFTRAAFSEDFGLAADAFAQWRSGAPTTPAVSPGATFFRALRAGSGRVRSIAKRGTDLPWWFHQGLPFPFWLAADAFARLRSGAMTTPVVLPRATAY